MPDVVGLGEAVEEEKRWAGTTFYTVDCDVFFCWNVESLEFFEHFGCCFRIACK